MASPPAGDPERPRAGLATHEQPPGGVLLGAPRSVRLHAAPSGVARAGLSPGALRAIAAGTRSGVRGRAGLGGNRAGGARRGRALSPRGDRGCVLLGAGIDLVPELVRGCGAEGDESVRRVAEGGVRRAGIPHARRLAGHRLRRWLPHDQERRGEIQPVAGGYSPQAVAGAPRGTSVSIRADRDWPPDSGRRSSLGRTSPRPPGTRARRTSDRRDFPAARGCRPGS